MLVGLKTKRRNLPQLRILLLPVPGNMVFKFYAAGFFRGVFIYPFRTLQPLVAVFYLPIAYDDDVRADLLHISSHNSSTVDREKCTRILQSGGKKPRIQSSSVNISVRRSPLFASSLWFILFLRLVSWHFGPVFRVISYGLVLFLDNIICYSATRNISDYFYHPITLLIFVILRNSRISKLVNNWGVPYLEILIHPVDHYSPQLYNIIWNFSYTGVISSGRTISSFWTSSQMPKTMLTMGAHRVRWNRIRDQCPLQ